MTSGLSGPSEPLGLRCTMKKKDDPADVGHRPNEVQKP